MSEYFNIAELARGALNERADIEVARVLNNIYDKNTPWKKARKVTLTLEFKANDESRESVSLNIEAKSSIAPYNSVTTQIYLGKDSSGNIVAEEYTRGTMPGQVSIDSGSGGISNPAGAKVVDFKKTGGKQV